MGKIVFLVGESGAGKSVRLARFARLFGIRTGVLTEREGDFRYARRLDTGERRLLARRRRAIAHSSTRHWAFDQDVFRWANDAFCVAGPSLIVDELGPLELVDGQGWSKAVEEVGCRDFSLVALRPSLVQIAGVRWPEAEFRYIRRR